jgi:hypothetical protein
MGGCRAKNKLNKLTNGQTNKGSATEQTDSLELQTFTDTIVTFESHGGEKDCFSGFCAFPHSLRANARTVH